MAGAGYLAANDNTKGRERPKADYQGLYDTYKTNRATLKLNRLLSPMLMVPLLGLNLNLQHLQQQVPLGKRQAGALVVPKAYLALT